MKTTEVMCTLCRNGCIITVQAGKDEEIEITGNGCMRGYALAQDKTRKSDE